MEDGLIRIDSNLSLPAAELTYRATRSGGPGGQHVNTSSTKVELLWDVGASEFLSAEQRDLLLRRLGNRIDKDGVLHLTEGGSRSQHRNREAVTERFRELVADALRVRKRRKRTRPPRRAKEERLREKKKRGEVKKLRGPIDPPD